MAKRKKALPAVRVEVLEQRILLAADLPVSGSDQPEVRAAESAPLQVLADDSSSASQAQWPGVATGDPLQLQSPSGSLLNLNSPSEQGQSLALNQGYTLLGTGVWDGPLNNGGVVAPGESPGILTVQSFEQQASGKLKIEIGGLTPGAGQPQVLDGYDRVAVSGEAKLAGTLSLDFINDFRPTAGQVFDVMTWSSRQGVFTSYTGLYAGNGIFLKPLYEANRLRLVATPLPGLQQLNVAFIPQAQQALDQWLTQLANQVSQAAVSLDASLDISGLRLSGTWQVAVGLLAGNQVETTLTAQSVNAQWSLPGLNGALTNLAGKLVMGPGTLQASLTGQGSLSAGNGPSIAGNFTLGYDQAQGVLSVSAQGLQMRAGDPARGAALLLSDGALSISSAPARFSLRVSGAATLQAGAGVSMQGSVSYLASSDSPGGRFEASDATLQLGSLGWVKGGVTFASQTEAAEGVTTQELLVGVQLTAAELSLGLLTLAGQNGALGVVFRTSSPTTGLGEATSRTAVQGLLDVSVALDSAVQLTGQRVRLSYNEHDQALLRSLKLPGGGDLLVDLPANALQMSGRFAIQVQGLGRLEGDLALDAQKRVRLLSNGQTIQLTEYALSGSRGLVALIPGASSSGAVSATEAEFALVYARDKDGNSWLSSRGAAKAMVVAGYALDNLESAQWSINRAITVAQNLQGVTIDWAEARRFTLASGRQFVLDQVGDVLSLPVQGALVLGDNRLSGQFTIAYERLANAWQLSIANAQWLLAAGPAFVRLNQASGQLRIDAERRRSGELSGQIEIGGVAGLTLTATAGRVVFDGAAGPYSVSLAGATLAVAGFGEISGNLSISRQTTAAGDRLIIAGTGLNALIGASGAQVSVTDARLGLILRTDAVGQAGFALVAEGGAALSTAGNQFSLSAQRARVEINRLGASVNETLTLADGSTVAMAFADERPVSSVSIANATLQLGSWGSLAGSLRIDSRQVAIGSTTRQQLEVGIEGLSGSLSLGGPAVSLSGGSGALLLFSETVSNQPVLRYAIQAEGEAALTGVAGLSLSAQRLQVGINRSGAAVERSIATPGGWVLMDQIDNETRVRGYAAVGIGDWLSAEGDIFLESRRNQTLTLSDGSTATADLLLLGGAGLSASVRAGASLALGNVNLAMALSTETTGAQRRWLSTSATVGSAEVTGVARASIDVGMLDINRQLASDGALFAGGDEKVINWRPGANSAGLPLVISDTAALVLDTQVSRLATAVQGTLAIGGAQISGTFHVVASSVVENGQTVPAWQVLATNASVSLQANGARASIENVTGDLRISSSGVTGTLSGDGSVTGINGVSASGSLSASIANDRLKLAGAMELGIAGVGQLAGSFSVIREPAIQSVPVFESLSSTVGAGATVGTSRAGGEVTTAVVRLNVSDQTGKFTREGLYTISWGGQSQTFSTLNADTAAGRPVTDEVLAARIQAAFERLAVVGAGNVQVKGTRTGGFDAEFIGSLAGQPIALASAGDQPGLWLIQPPDPADKNDWGVIEETAAMQIARSEVQQLVLNRASGAGGSFTLSLAGSVTAPIVVDGSDSAVNERQVLTITAANRASGQFWLSLDGRTTSKVRFSADPTYHTAQLQQALEAVVGAGNVSVSYQKGYTGHNSVDYVIDFRGARAGLDVSALQGFSSSSDIKLALKTVRQGSPGFSVIKQARAIETALQTALGTGNVSVAYDPASTLSSSRFQISFAGTLAAQNLPALQVGAASAGLSPSVSTSRDGSAAIGAVQTVRLYDERVVGTFELSLWMQGKTHTTSPLSFSASAQQVKSALLAARAPDGQSLAQRGVELAVDLLTQSDGAKVWRVAFGGSASDLDLDVMLGRITSAVAAPEAGLAVSRQ
ncbi:MAG: LEPR-XLL domain-containing protein, partial [Betaproteobacteria bacterium]